MIKCSNPKCSVFKGHLWVVDGKVYCSPWCQRNWGRDPNSAGPFKKLALDTRRKV